MHPLVWTGLIVAAAAGFMTLRVSKDVPVIRLFMGFGALSAWLVASATLESFPGPLIDGGSALVVLGSLFFFTLSAHPVSSIRAAIVAAQSEGPIDPGEARAHEAVLTSLNQICLVAGAVATTIGLLKMLVNMSDPTTIGPAVGVSLLGLLYSVLVSGLLIAPLRFQLTARLARRAS